MSEQGHNGLPTDPQYRRGFFKRMLSAMGRHTRRTFIAGSLLLIPIAMTYAIIAFIYGVVNEVLRPSVERMFHGIGIAEWIFPGLGVVAAVLLVYTTGVVLAWGLGVSIVRWWQRAAAHMPVVGTIYSAARQLVESFSGSGPTGFQRVVLIQYPRQGYWALGFLTSIVHTDSGERLAVVYIPTAPLPNSGWLTVVPFTEVYDTEISAQAAMQFVFSGGLITPETINWTLSKEASE